MCYEKPGATTDTGSNSDIPPVTSPLAFAAPRKDAQASPLSKRQPIGREGPTPPHPGASLRSLQSGMGDRDAAADESRSYSPTLIVARRARFGGWR